MSLLGIMVWSLIADRFRAWYGRHMTNLDPFDLDSAEVEGVVKLGSQHTDSAFPAMYLLLLFDVSMIDISQTRFPADSKTIAGNAWTYRQGLSGAISPDSGRD